MDYIHESFQYAHQPSHQAMYYQPMPYPVYMQPHPQQLEDFYHQYPHADYPDFMHSTMMHDDYDETGEVSTRPRLTKEQVEVLEAQFQAHPKPNSVVKRQLAMQTKLTLPRVANWFQNRRAKAKQQKKQEEFEITQSLEAGVRTESESVDHEDQSEENDDAVTSNLTLTGATNSPRKVSSGSTASSSQPETLPDTSKEASWASLQRALAAAKAGHAAQHTVKQNSSMQPPSVPQQNMSMQLPFRVSPNLGTGDIPDWPIKQTSMDVWSPNNALNDSLFDFGFPTQMESSVSIHDSTADESPQNMSTTSYTVSPDVWQESLSTPTGLAQSQMESDQLSEPPEFRIPVYSTSRRGSVADDLTANFGSFALASNSEHSMGNLMPTDGQLDIAARRKRPRPAALTSASLRSRSYGAMTSASPTFRNGSIPSSHVIRHVKSTGHGLNNRYSGIRKASSAQRSPMNVSTFTEAEAFNRLMAQQAALTKSQSVSAGPTDSAGLLSAGLPVLDDNNNNTYRSKVEMVSPYQLASTQHLTLTTSPPSTPFRPEFMNQMRPQQSMPPVSAPPQYASFPDYTPPYSAGPLTNSSWSDAPLTSPELPSFPHVTYIPSLTYVSQSDNLSAPFSQFVLPSDTKSDYNIHNSNMDHKKTEFFIQEFPNQKEEHAHVAQQLAQQKPKNYVFANSAPGDYD